MCMRRGMFLKLTTNIHSSYHSLARDGVVLMKTSLNSWTLDVCKGYP